MLCRHLAGSRCDRRKSASTESDNCHHHDQQHATPVPQAITRSRNFLLAPYYYRPILKCSIFRAREGRRIDMSVKHSHCLFAAALKEQMQLEKVFSLILYIALRYAPVVSNAGAKLGELVHEGFPHEAEALTGVLRNHVGWIVIFVGEL